MKTVLFITRHGESEHNLNARVFMGRSPASRLTEEGRRQAHLLAGRLTGRLTGRLVGGSEAGEGKAIGRMGGGRMGSDAAVETIVCSSLPRTEETARIVADALGVADVHGEEAFWELNKGSWEGTMPRDNIPPQIERDLRADPYGFRYPQGESYRDVCARVAPAFDRWVARLAGRNVLFVLHGDVIRALLHHLLRFPPDKIGDFATDPCALTEFALQDGRYQLIRFNDASHLD